jgi:hypothetical protein
VSKSIIRNLSAAALPGALALALATSCGSDRDNMLWLFLGALGGDAAVSPGAADSNADDPVAGDTSGAPDPFADCKAAGGVGVNLAGQCVMADYVLTASRDRTSGVTINANCPNPSGTICEDGVAYFAPVILLVPAEFPGNAAGAPGNHSAQLAYDNVVCIYGGNGPNTSSGTKYVASIVGGSIGSFSNGSAKEKGYCYTLDPATGAPVSRELIPAAAARTVTTIGLRVNNSASGKLTQIQSGGVTTAASSSALTAHLGGAQGGAVFAALTAGAAAAGIAVIAALRRLLRRKAP